MFKTVIKDNIYYYKDKEMKILHREDGPAIELADGTKHFVPYVGPIGTCMVNVIEFMVQQLNMPMGTNVGTCMVNVIEQMDRQLKQQMGLKLGG